MNEKARRERESKSQGRLPMARSRSRLLLARLWGVCLPAHKHLHIVKNRAPDFIIYFILQGN